MRKIAIRLALVAIVTLPLDAMGAYYTLDVGQLWSTFLSIDDGLDFSNQSSIPTGVQWSGGFVQEPGPWYAMFGYNFGSPQDLSAYEGFGLCLTNLDDNAWNLALYAEEDGGAWAQYSPGEINPNATICITRTWAALGVDPEAITALGLGVYSTNLPLGEEGDDYEFWMRATPLTDEPQPEPVPEPGTLALFGFGVAGAAASYRRKRAAKRA